jgi:hypothetical protein
LMKPSTQKAAIHYSGYSYKVSWSLMKRIKKTIKSPLFCFHGNCGSLSNRFRFFWLISFH